MGLWQRLFGAREREEPAREEAAAIEPAAPEAIEPAAPEANEPAAPAAIEPAAAQPAPPAADPAEAARDVAPEPAQPTVETPRIERPRPQPPRDASAQPGVPDVEPDVRALGDEPSPPATDAGEHAAPGAGAPADEAELEARLERLLDSLGAAHRRPFTRAG